MASGTRRFRTEFGAAAIEENLLAGTPLEYPGVMSSLEIAATIETAANIGQVTMDVLIGTDVVAEAMVVGAEDTLLAPGSGPKIPANILLREGIGPADHVQIRLRNTVGANDVQTLVRIQPV